MMMKAGMAVIHKICEVGAEGFLCLGPQPSFSGILLPGGGPWLVPFVL